jgi:hypothetical protein
MQQSKWNVEKTEASGDEGSSLRGLKGWFVCPLKPGAQAEGVCFVVWY